MSRRPAGRKSGRRGFSSGIILTVKAPAKRYVLDVEIERLDDGRYIADCPDFEGCHAEGETPSDALENLEEVARMILDLCRQKGLPLPPELDEGGGPQVIRARLVVAA